MYKAINSVYLEKAILAFSSNLIWFLNLVNNWVFTLSVKIRF